MLLIGTRTAWAAVVGSVLAGVGLAYLILGPRPLDPTNSSWVTGDSAASYLGWLFFRGEAALGLPLGWASKLGYPLGEPIAYLDSVPIVALLFWPFGDLLPPTFQYHGLVFAAQCGLQCYFGYRICLQLSGLAHGPAFAGGLLFMIAPAFVWRMLGHLALANQWLLLAAIELYLLSRSGLSRRWAVASAALCFVAGGINPYLAFMTLLILAAALLSAQSHRHQRLVLPGLPAAALLALLAVVALGSLTIFGFIRPGDPGAYAGGGYGMYSMNLLAPIDPMEFPALVLKQQATVPGQYEGYNYLGLGLLALALASIARRPSVLGWIRSSPNLPIMFVAGLSLLLALSSKVTLGTLTLYDLHLPHGLSTALSSFRASGRLFWTAYYLIITGIMAAAFLAFGRRALPVLLLVLAIQFADGRGLVKAVRAQWDSSSAQVFTDEPVWQDAASRHRHLIVVPPWQCDPRATPGGLNGFWIFGKLAGAHGLTLNSFYAGRTSPRQLDYFCATQPSEIARDGLQEEALYVFPNVASLLTLPLRSHYCQGLDGVVACGRDAARSGIDLALQTQLPVAAGELSFDAANPGSAGVLGLGWAGPEAWGRWSNSRLATMAFRTADPARALAVEITVVPFTPAGRPQRLTIVAARPGAEGLTLGEWTLTSDQDITIRFEVPAEAIWPDGTVSLRLQLPDAQSPTSLGLSFDSRLLGIGLKRLRVTAR